MKRLLLLILLFAFVNTRAGVFEWAKGFGSSVQDEGRSIAVDAAGNVYTIGTFRYTADFNPDTGVAELTTAGDDDLFIQKLNTNGQLVWARQVGGTGWENPHAIAIDNQGNLYITGSFSGTADFNPDTTVTANLTSTGIDDIFVLRLTSGGDFVWVKQFGGPGTDDALGIATNGAAVYVTGRFQQTADFDPSGSTANLTAGGSGDDIFICKLDIAGNYQWAKGMGDGIANDYGLSVTVDASGNIFATGYFSGTFDFDPGAGTATVTAAGGFDIFLCKFSASGDLLWVKQFGTTGYDIGYDVVTDATGDVYTTGRFEGTVDFDPGAGTTNLATTSTSDADIYLCKYDASGNLVWAKGMGSGMPEWGQSVDLDGVGGVYLAGFFQGTVDFDPGAGSASLTSTGGDDAFIAKYDLNGNYVWANAMGGSNASFGDRSQAVALDATGSIYTAGWFYDTGDFDPYAGTEMLTSQGSYDIFVQKIAQPGNGIKETVLSDITTYPNPTNGKVYLRLSDNEQIESIMVIDALGQLVATGSNVANNYAELVLEGCNGLYFVEVKTNNKAVARIKVLKY